MDRVYNKGIAITKSDTVDFPDGTCDAIFVGGAGVVVVVFPDNSTVSYTCVAGQELRVKARRVNATNTTATAMIAEYMV